MDDRKTPTRAPIIQPEPPSFRRVHRPANANADALQAEYEALLESKRRILAMEAELAARLDAEDVSRPIALPMPMASAVPSSDRSLSQDGLPTLTARTAIPVRLSLGTWALLIGGFVSIAGTAALFVVQAQTHRDDHRVHLDPKEGIGWGSRSMFETRMEAAKARYDFSEDLKRTQKIQHEEMQGELIRVLGGRVKYNQWREAKSQVPTSVAPPQITPEG